MIQRIQSLYLLIHLILSALLFFFPFQTNIVNLSEIKDLQLTLTSSENTYLLLAAILNLIILVDTATIIFLYKNRKLQMFLCHYLTAMNIVLLILMYFGANQVEGLPTYKLPFIIPVLNIVLSQLARYFIHKDEELVSSANRIR